MFKILLLSIVLYFLFSQTHLLAQNFYDLGKNVCTVGGDLQTFFGILNERTRNYYIKNNIEIQHKESWITNIPDEYKPTDYMKIEDGCYW